MTKTGGVLLILIGMTIQAFSNATLTAFGLIQLSYLQQITYATFFMVVIIVILLLRKKGPL